MVKKEQKNIGIPGIENPKDKCSDPFCPFHGGLKIRGRVFNGTVVSVKPMNTAIIRWDTRIFIPKYERFQKRRSKVYAHAPSCLHVHKDDKVVIGECRPLSKTKKFSVLKKVEEEKWRDLRQM